RLSPPWLAPFREAEGIGGQDSAGADLDVARPDMPQIGVVVEAPTEAVCRYHPWQEESGVPDREATSVALRHGDISPSGEGAHDLNRRRTEQDDEQRREDAEHEREDQFHRRSEGLF